MNKQQIIEKLWDHGVFEDDHAKANELAEEILRLMPTNEQARQEGYEERRANELLEKEAAWQLGVLEEEKPKEYRGRLFWPEVSWYEGEPCKHPGCKSHVSHPCEGCGRQWGTIQRTGDEVV